MVMMLQFTDVPGSPLRVPDQWDVSAIPDAGSIEQLFDSPSQTAPYPFVDNSFEIDVARQQIAIVENRVLRWIAGIKYVVGDRDGEASQALIGIGGGWASSVVGYMQNSKGDLYFTASRYHKIKKLSKQPDGSFQISTFLTGIDSVSIFFDPQDNLWTATTYEGIKKFSPDGTLLATYALPLANGVWSMSPDQVGHLWLNYRESYTNTIWQLDMATGVITRKAGLLYDEYVALQAAGIVPPIDGALNYCTIHTADFGYISPDGNTIFMGGGDESQVRKLDFTTGRCSSLCTDGVWRELQDIRGGMYVGSPAGIDENGWPYSRVYPWINAGWSRTLWRKMVLVDQPPPPPPPPPPTPPAMQINSANLNSSVASGGDLTISVSVTNLSQNTIDAALADPSFIYDESGTYPPSISGQWRIGVDYEGRTGNIDHPYRWGLGAPLLAGESRNLEFKIKLNTLGTKKYWVGLVEELIAWHQDNLGTTAVTVTSGGINMGITVSWPTVQNEAVSTTADHFLCQMDGANDAVESLSSRTHVFVNADATKPHMFSVLCVDAAGAAVKDTNGVGIAALTGNYTPNTAPIPVAPLIITLS